MSKNPELRVFRRPEPTLPIEGRLVLEYAGRWLDLTEYLWQRELPIELGALVAQDWFESEAMRGRLESGGWRETGPVRADEELFPPLLPREVGKILALGKNYRAHAEEFGEAVPERLLFFGKLPETLRGNSQPVVVPPTYTGRFDHEVELAVLIGREGRAIAPARALSHVAGFTVANDLTARSMQGADRAAGRPWFQSKNFEGSCPLGPCFVPTWARSIERLAVRCEVNGELRQQASTADLVVDVPHALAALSQHLPLFPGDIVLMGTPAGVGPLRDGDEVCCEIEGIGRLRTPIRRPAAG